MEEPKKDKGKVRSVEHIYNLKNFQIEKTEEDKYGKLHSFFIFKKEFQGHQGGCNHKACEQLGVSFEHLEKSYELLNGRKLDGIFITDMIDRYGFKGSPQMNRANLALKNNKSIQSLETAYNKLRGVLSYADVLGAYMKHQKDYEDMLLKVRRDAVVDGE